MRFFKNMKYGIRDIPDFLRSPMGRRYMAHGLMYMAWPVLSRLAATYRRTFLGKSRVIAVTGSFGKSTTARAIDAALGNDPEKTALSNTWSHIAVKTLCQRPGGGHRVIEAGISGPGQMKKYAAMIRPDVAVVTTIGSEHNRSFKTLERTRDEKADVVRALSAKGLAVLNNDDPNVMWMRDKTRARVVTYGLGPESDVRATDIRLDWPHGTSFTLHAGGRSYGARTRLFGRHMVYSALAAFAAATQEGVAPETVIARLATLSPTPGRCEPVTLENGATVLRDDYKSARETVDAALELLAEIPERRKIAVLGNVSELIGRPAPVYRELGARFGAVVTDLVLVCNYASGVTAGARSAGLGKGHIVNAQGIAAAIEFLKKTVKPEDVVFIKGSTGQHLERVALALMGRDVRCDIKLCRVRTAHCSICPMLERGWQGLRIIT